MVKPSNCLVELARSFAAVHGNADRRPITSPGAVARALPPPGLPRFDQVTVGIADEYRAAGRRRERDASVTTGGREPSAGRRRPRIADREDERRRARVPRIGRPIAAWMSKNSDSSSPNGVLAARMNTVRKREPRVFVRSQTVDRIRPATRAGLSPAARRRVRRRRKVSAPVRCRRLVIEGECALGIARAVNPVVDAMHREPFAPRRPVRRGQRDRRRARPRKKPSTRQRRPHWESQCRIRCDRFGKGHHEDSRTPNAFTHGRVHGRDWSLPPASDCDRCLRSAVRSRAASSSSIRRR